MAKANAQVEITASSSRLVAGLTAAGAKFKSWAASTASSMGKAFGKVNEKLKLGETGSRAVGNLAGDLLGKGLEAITGAAGDVRNFERNLIRLQIATDGSKESTAAMRKEIGAISRDTGVARDEVLAGAQAYVGFTGDAKGATQAARLFADVSTATGASVTDVAQAMAALKTSMGITAAEGEAAFSALIVQGKGGAVEIKDMAGELAALAPQFAQFKGGKGVEGLRELGAGFQVVMKNSSSASDAATKYQALMGSLADKRTLKELKKIGVQVFDNNGKLKDATTIFHDLAKNQKLADSRNLSNVFGRKEAQLAVLALREHIDEYDNLRTAANDTGAVQRDKMTMLESDAGRLDRAMNSLKIAIAEAFTPERIAAFTNAIEGLVDKVGPLVDALGKVADYTLGAAYGFGKSVRGALEGPANPFQRRIESSRAERGDFMRTSPLNKAEQALERNAKGWEEAKNRILGSEKGERVTPQSIAAAYESSMARGGYEKIGEAQAGESYLRNAGVTPDQAREVFEKQYLAANEKGFQMIADAITGMKTPTVQVGDNQMNRATQRSTDARRNAH